MPELLLEATVIHADAQPQGSRGGTIIENQLNFERPECLVDQRGLEAVIREKENGCFPSLIYRGSCDENQPDLFHTLLGLAPLAEHRRTYGYP